MTTTMPADLEQAVRDALPDLCEVHQKCGHLCRQTAAWSVVCVCTCTDQLVVLVCEGHIGDVRSTDYVCAVCLDTVALLGVRRL